MRRGPRAHARRAAAQPGVPLLLTTSAPADLAARAGVLTAQFVKLVCELYCHVCAQGDPDDGGIYGERSPVAPERLPKWYPRVDGAGFSREERLRMAVCRSPRHSNS